MIRVAIVAASVLWFLLWAAYIRARDFDVALGSGYVVSSYSENLDPDEIALLYGTSFSRDILIKNLKTVAMYAPSDIVLGTYNGGRFFVVRSSDVVTCSDAAEFQKCLAQYGLGIDFLAYAGRPSRFDDGMTWILICICLTAWATAMFLVCVGLRMRARIRSRRGFPIETNSTQRAGP